jgi:4-hydroxythreonine-4-phosphate dehydrogenase
MNLPTIAITVGDPSGIGPEIAIKAARDPRVTSVCQPVLYGPHSTEEISAFPAGEINAESARAAYNAIVRATEDALAGRVDAIATAPVNKASFAAAGIPWLGHTDLLGHLCGVRDVAMMFWSEKLSVVLATIHIPLAQVPAAITVESMRRIITLTAESLPRFGMTTPRIAVAGLNPHAGEDGLLGHEDADVIRPAIAEAQRRGVNVSGPYPADTLFVRAIRGEFDVVIAAYHDQGLVPVKLVAFGHSVNVTLGLPIIRTSVDHGTAFDIARKGAADAGSMVEAVTLAARLARRPDRASAKPRT